MATQPPPPLTLQDLGLKASSTIGAILIGSFVVAMLYGIIVIQTMLFFQGQSHNNRYMRYTVAGLWVMNSVHMAFIIHPVYWYLVSNYLQPLAIVQIVWSVSAGVIVTAVNDFIVRCWFVYRIWILSGRNRWATFPMTILCIFLFGLTIVTGVEFYQTKTYLRLVHTHVRWLVYTDLSLVFAADVLIAATLCYLLAISRTKAMNHKTESYVNILILYTINTGLLTSMLSMACLITFVTMPHNYVFVALYFPMMTLYANSLLASFNMRDSLKQEPSSFAAPLSTMKFHQHSAICHCSCQSSSHAAHPEYINDTESGGNDLVVHTQTGQSKATL